MTAKPAPNPAETKPERTPAGGRVRDYALLVGVGIADVRRTLTRRAR